MLRVLQTRRLVQPVKPFLRNYFIKHPKLVKEPKDVFPFDPRNTMKFTYIFGGLMAFGFYLPIVVLFYMKNKLG